MDAKEQFIALATQQFVSVLSNFTDKERIEILERVGLIFCVHCGQKNSEENLEYGFKCQCWNDD